MRILIIDDSKTMRNIEKSILAELGYTSVFEAEDGKVAMEMVDQVAPDLILLDWNMPVMDGISFARNFRAVGGTTPIIMVTTEAEKSRIVEAIKAGVNNYVVKPFTPDSLSTKVKETIARFGKAA
jgi:two-component system chemotaxis response regulator CheY